jgi:hypothetical protein
MSLSANDPAKGRVDDGLGNGPIIEWKNIEDF